MPHSEIHGSQPIPGSSWLIAGYHVLHRLLLPRHSPNALLALDLIQKKKDFKVPYRLFGYLRAFSHPVITDRQKDRSKRSLPQIKSILSRAILRWHFLVSVLDLDDAAASAHDTCMRAGNAHTCLPPRGKQPGHPLTRGRQQRRYCISLNDVKTLHVPPPCGGIGTRVRLDG